MTAELHKFLLESQEALVRAGIILGTLILAYVGNRLSRKYIVNFARNRQFAERRTYGITKFSKTIIYMLAALIISNVLGFGLQGIFVATGSFFAIVGIAFFATWSVLSNVTSSVIIYFTFPFRIGDRIQVENEPKFNGVLKDVTLFYLRVQTDLGSTITIPANVAIQKIIIIQSERDRKLALEEAQSATLKQDA